MCGCNIIDGNSISICCGAAVERRPDDHSPEFINQRIERFNKDKSEILKYFTSRNSLLVLSDPSNINSLLRDKTESLLESELWTLFDRRNSGL